MRTFALLLAPALALAARTAWSAPPNADELWQVRTDFAAGVIDRRDQGTGNARIFGAEYRYHGAIRGAFTYREWPGNWDLRIRPFVGYRYEPGRVVAMYASDAADFTSGARGSRGIESTLIAHDMSFGLVVDYWFCMGAVRLWLGNGPSFTHLQVQSLDDGHVYSDPGTGWNESASLDLALHLWGAFEAFLGTGYFEVPSEDFRFEQSGTPLETEGTRIRGVDRSGILFYGGIGLEY